MGGEVWRNERYLAILPLPAVLLFTASLLINDREFLTANQQLICIGLAIAICGAAYTLMLALLRRSAAMKELFRTHGPYVLILLLLILVKYNAVISSHLLLPTDPITFNDFVFLKYSVLKYHHLPLWNTDVWSGSPSHALADKWYFYPLVWPFIFLPIILAINMLTIFTAVLGGTLMYILVIHLSKSEQAGLVSALVFIFSGFFMDKAHLLFCMMTFPMALIPGIFLSLTMLTQQKKLGGFLRWGAVTGLLLGFQILSGYPEYFIYTSYFVMGLYLGISLLTNARLRKALPSLVIAVIIIVSLTGTVSAVKMLPAFDFLKMTPRAEPMSRSNIWPIIPPEESPLQIMRFLVRSSWERLGAFDKVYNEEEVGELGLIGFLLALAALSRIKTRSVLFLVLTAAIVVLIATPLKVYVFTVKSLPLLNYVHVPGRLFIIFVFCGAALSGIGWSVISKRIPQRWLKWAFAILLSLLVLDLIIFGLRFTKTTPYLDTLKDNQIIEELGSREGLFRVASFQVKGIDWGMMQVTVPLEIQYNQGYEGIGNWIADYWEYLSISYNNLSRFWGMLNLKYAVSSEIVEEPGFTLEQTFERCYACDYPEAADHYDGPYLYVNDNALPRAYTVDNAVLVTGEWESTQEVVYSLLAHPAFNPQTTVIIHDPRRLSEIPWDELSEYKAIVPLSQLGSVDRVALQGAKDAGAAVLPDVLAGETGITNGQIAALFERLGSEGSGIQEVEIPLYTQNNVGAGPVQGGRFLVLTEKYFLFPGDWKASAGKEPIKTLLRANAMATAIPFAGRVGETVTFDYRPVRFSIGLAASLIGLLAGIALIWQPWGRQKPKKKSDR